MIPFIFNHRFDVWLRAKFRFIVLPKSSIIVVGIVQLNMCNSLFWDVSSVSVLVHACSPLLGSHQVIPVHMMVRSLSTDYQC